MPKGPKAYNLSSPVSMVASHYLLCRVQSHLSRAGYARCQGLLQRKDVSTHLLHAVRVDLPVNGLVHFKNRFHCNEIKKVWLLSLRMKVLKCKNNYANCFQCIYFSIPIELFWGIRMSPRHIDPKT